MRTLSGTRIAGIDGWIAASSRSGTRDRVEEALRQALITGQIQPGRSLTLRGLAAGLGTSPMPVREAVRGLAATGALEIGTNGRIHVPQMTQRRLDDLMAARTLLEPAVAEIALPQLDRRAAKALAAIDDRIDESLTTGDVEGYMRFNHAFHFGIYRASGSDLFIALVETVWLQFGPFMRRIYGRVGTASLVDQHKAAIEAIAQHDAAALKTAIAADIEEGMRLIGQSLADETAGELTVD